jgi:site-specific recombinase XerD
MQNSEALQRFQAYLRRRYSDRRTPVDYVSDVRQFQKNCAKSWETVTAQDVDLFLDQMRQCNLKPATIKRRLSALKVYFDFLADTTAQLYYTNPVNLKRHSVKLGRHLPHDLSDAEVDRLMAQIDSPRDRALAALMLRAGLRVGEVVTLTLDTLIPAPRAGDLARLRVVGKGRKERIVYLSHETIAALKAWLTVRPSVPSRMLFLNQRAEPLTPSGVEWLFQRYGEQVGIHLTPHRLRHTFARQLTEAQMPVESLALLMGHAQISTTQIYLAGANPQLRNTFDQAMKRLESATPTPPGPAYPLNALSPTASPDEPLYPLPPDGTTWATDLPEPIRQACLDYVRRHLAGWRPSQRRLRARQVLGDFERFFDWVLQRRMLQAVTDLLPTDLAEHMAARVAAGNKPNTIKDALARVFGLLHELAEQGAPVSPALFRVQRPRLPDPLPRALAELEAQRLEAHMRPCLQSPEPHQARDAAWFFLLAHAGLRACELLDVRQADVDEAGRRLYIRSGKQDRDRVVYLSETALQAVQNYLTRCPHPEHALLFVHPNGQPLSYGWLYQHLRDLAEAAQIKSVSPNRLRHTFATRLVNAGMPITSLQKLMGHAHLSTTQIYARMYDATVERDYRQAMDRIQRTDAIAVPAEWFARPATAPDAIAVPRKGLDNSV